MNRESRSAGFVLAMVLWLLVAVGAASAAFQATARTNRLGSINAGADIRARWAAREGLSRAIDAVERLGMSQGDWESAGLGRTIVLAPLEGGEGSRITVRIEDARSRLDLNHATPAEIERLLYAVLERSPSRVPQIRDRILDWRDPDSRRRRLGAEASDYLRLDAPGRSGDGPFETVADLGEVVGIDGEIAEILAPLVTVDGDGIVNANTASPPVLAAVMGIDVRSAGIIAERVRVEQFANVFEVIRTLPSAVGRDLEARVPALQERLGFAPRDLEIHVTASVPGTGVVARIDASLRMVRAGLWQFGRVVEY